MIERKIDNMEKLVKRIIAVSMLLTMFVGGTVPTSASVKQTENTKTLSVGNGSCKLIAYAAFDRFGSNLSNGKAWDYTGRASITDAPDAGTLKLTITGQATMKTSASMSIGAGIEEVSASASGSWQTMKTSYSQTKSIKKQSKKQSTSDTSNLVVTPRKYYDTNTACITVSSRVKFKNGTNKWYRISTIA